MSVPTAYKVLSRARRLGLVEQRGRNLYPARARRGSARIGSMIRDQLRDLVLVAGRPAVGPGVRAVAALRAGAVARLRRGAVLGRRAGPVKPLAALGAEPPCGRLTGPADAAARGRP